VNCWRAFEERPLQREAVRGFSKPGFSKGLLKVRKSARGFSKPGFSKGLLKVRKSARGFSKPGNQ